MEGAQIDEGRQLKAVAVSSLGMVIVPISVSAVGIERMDGFKISLRCRLLSRALRLNV